MLLKRIVSVLLLTATLSMSFSLSAVGAAASKLPANALSIVSYGAKPNDAKDDLAAIKKCIADAKKKGKSVYIPNGTFLYSGIITLDGVDMAGVGSSSILKCTSLNNQCIVMKGKGTDLSKIKLTTVPVKNRLSTDESARILVLNSATNFTIKNVEIDGGSSAGIFNTGKNGVISSNTVKNTLADGIHNTGGADNILVEKNVCRNNGDDQIAVVSYEKNNIVSKRITIRNNDLAGGHARGITVSGGSDINIESNRIADTLSAGIFISSEGSYKTYAVTNLIVKNNSITRDTKSAAASEKGGIRLQATYKDPSIKNALFENNTLTDSGDNGIMIVGSANIFATFKNNKIVNPKGYGIYILKIVTGEITFSKNTVTGAKKDSFFNQAASAKVTSDMENTAAGNESSVTSKNVAVKGTPVIDGKVDALWDGATKLQMDKTDNGTTGTCRIAWDEKALYYLFEMKDSTSYALANNENNDSVEVWVDELNCKQGAMKADDYQLRVDIKNATSTSMEKLDMSNVKSAVTTDKGSYIIEIAVPYRTLTPKAGDVIGFNSSANDDSNGDGQRDNYISWIDKNLPYWADTKVYNTVQLQQ